MRANTGQPAVVFPATRFSNARELHGKDAADWYRARDKARAEMELLKAKLRGMR